MIFFRTAPSSTLQSLLVMLLLLLLTPTRSEANKSTWKSAVPVTTAMPITALVVALAVAAETVQVARAVVVSSVMAAVVLFLVAVETLAPRVRVVTRPRLLKFLN